MTKTTSARWIGAKTMLIKTLAVLGMLACTLSRQALMAEGTGILEAAPVLGKILDKSLAEQGIRINSLQWARIEGRGLVYIAGVNLLNLRSSEAKTDNSEEDHVWENARRELQGRPRLQKNEGERTRITTETIQAVLKRFSSRIAMPEGEEIRVVVYPATGDCSNCHGSPIYGDSRYYEKDDGGGAGAEGGMVGGSQGSSGGGGDGDAVVIARLLARDNVHGSTPREFLYVSSKGELSRGAEKQSEDAAVLAKVLGKKLAASFPDEFWGVDTKRRPGAFGLSLGDWGPLVVLNLTFPLERKTNQPSSENRDIWEETVRELRGEFGLTSSVNSGTRRLWVQSDKFLSTVKTVLADFGGRVRNLAERQNIYVLVYSSTASVRADAASPYQYLVGRPMRGVTYSALTGLPSIPATNPVPEFILSISGITLQTGDEMSRLERIENVRVR